MLLQKIRTTAIAVCLLACGLQGLAQAPAPAPANPVAPLMVNGQAADGTRLDILLMEQLSQGRPDNTQLRGAVREDLIRLELLAQEARKAGIDKQTLARAQASLAFDAVLTRAYLQQWLQRNPILLDAVQAEYDALKVRMGGQEVQIRHILVASLDEAVKVQVQIAAGGKFEELAASVSQDAASKKAGGLMPWVVQGALLPDIAQAIAKLNKGQMANAPVKGPAGYHLIQLEDTRPFKAPELAEVQVQIKRNLESQAINVHIQKLREQASVK
jgi:peptidyl-prolyl cis-trans isomerase C